MSRTPIRRAFTLFALSFVMAASGEDLPGGLFQRIIIGAEGSGGAATTPKGRYFTNIFLSSSLFSKKEDTSDGTRWLGPRFRLWVDTRITSVPQQFNAKISEFDVIAGFKDLKVNEVAQAFEMLGGAQFRVWGQSEARTLFFDPSRYSRTSLALIGSYGGTTPFVPADNIETFAMPDAKSDAYARLKAAYGKERDRQPGAKNLAFVLPDHSRFWRQYYAGVRIQSFFFTKDDKGEQFSQVPPRTVDLMVGQNELVTGGHTRGLVFRGDFFQPVVNISNKGTFYVFGTAIWKASVGPDATQDALVLMPASNVDATATTTLLLTAKPSNRDLFRFGIGFDLKRIFDKP